MSIGFYHPDRGYWQTTATPSEAILSSYPEGTVQVSLKPGSDYDYDGTQWVHTPQAPTGEQVNVERDRRIEAGAEFTLSDSTVIAITGREKDKTVLLGRLLAAQQLKADDVTAAVLIYRDRDNVNRLLTPDQMIELYTQGLKWVEDMMARSWDMKDGTGDYTDGIPADYDQDSHWPEPA